jgi:glyoxylase-like metal-dependent hydrolase (beta-lactamase superfamily II)
MKIIPLSEGAFTVDQTKQFQPFDKNIDQLSNRTRGSLLVEIQPFCIVTSADIIIIDTGLGFTNSDNTMQIHQNLIDQGISPMEVTKVLISHLHKDHAGGISTEDEMLKQSFFTFPNALFYVNEEELSYAIQKGRPSYVNEDFEILIHSDKVVLTGRAGSIDGYITFQTTGGHSPFHQVFWINEDGRKIFFGGDITPQLQQMKNRFVAKYDYDGKRSMELRQEWWQEGAKEKWTFLFYHDIKTPMFDFNEL